MNLEDEKAKIRRNLVLFCSVYLGLAYLDIPVQQIVNQTLLLKMNASISQQKTMVLSAVIFVYLLWRWLSSDDQQGEFSKNKDNFSVRYYLSIFEWTQDRAKSRDFDQYCAFEGRYKDEFDAWFNNLHMDGKSQVEVFLELRQKSYRGARFMAKFQAPTLGLGQFSTCTVNLCSMVPFGRLSIFVLRGFVFMICRFSFLEWVFPAALALGTLGVMIYRWGVTQ